MCRSFSVFLTAMLFIAAAATARADDESRFRIELRQIQTEMRELSVEVIQFQLAQRYCLPPYPPLKQPHQMILDGYKARAKVLNDRYVATINNIVDFFEGNHELRRQLLQQDGLDRADRRYWGKTNFNLGRQRMNATVAKKQAELDGKRERDCTPRAEPKTIGVVGGNPPVQPPPPPPPPPPPSVDPMKGLTRPAFVAVKIPLLVDRYCSQAKKDAALAQFPPEFEKLNGQIADMDAYIASVNARKGELKARGVEQHWLDSMDYERHQAEIMRDDRRNTIDMLNTTRRLIESTPVVDCTTGKKIGSLPGNTGLSAGAQVAAGDLTIPKKPYLSKEFGGNQFLGVVDHEKTANVATLLLMLGYQLDIPTFVKFAEVRRQVSRVIGEFQTHDFDVRSHGGSIVTTTEGIGIPGTGDPLATYPAGVFFGNPAFNDVTDIGFSHMSKYRGFSLGLEQKSDYDCGALTLAGGLTYLRLNTSDALNGRVAAYPIDFSYMTDVKTSGVGLFVRGGVEIPVDNLFDQAIRYAGEFSGFRLSAGGEGRVNFLDAEGFDRLSLAGFVSDAQRVRLSKDDTTFSFKVGASLNYRPPGLTALDFGIGVEYGQDNIHPVASRSGETGDTTHIEFEDQDIFVGTFRSRISF